MYSSDSDASISVSSSVLPYTITQKSSDFSVNSMIASIIIVMGLAYIPSYYIYFVVKEKESNVKHQQLISGLSLPAYWISNLIWDYLCYLIPYYIYICSCIFGIAMMYAFSLDEFTKNIGAVIVLFLEYGISTALFTYFTSYFFKSRETAQNIVYYIHFIDNTI